MKYKYLLLLIIGFFLMFHTSCTLENENTNQNVEKSHFENITFNSLSVTYDGEPHILAEVSGAPSFATVAYENRDSHVEVGSWNAKATITADNYNDLVLYATLTIKKANFTNITFASQEVEYDSSLHRITCQNVPSFASVTYENNTGTNAGTYDATATIKADNYNDLVLYSTLTIKKAKFNDITFDSLEVEYDANSHTITCENVPSFASVTYQNNTGTKVGTYNAKATIKADNYEDLVLNATLKIKAFDSATKLGTKPIISESGRTVTYGLYPQTIVTDQQLISELNGLSSAYIASNHWYHYGNYYYAKVIAEPNDDNFKFSDGSTIVDGNVYWFKCEPIEWIILSQENNKYFLMSTYVLDDKQYTTHTSSYDDPDGHYIGLSNYRYSDLRAWLNEEFYKSAFALNSEYVLQTSIDNSYSQTDGENRWNYSPSTSDFVSVLSYKELLTYDYGFTTTTTQSLMRIRQNTDYSRAIGAFEDGYNNSIYWTRSPASESRSAVYVVGYNGEMRTVSATRYYGICPSIYIEIK